MPRSFFCSLLLLVLSTNLSYAQELSVNGLTCNHLVEPTGIDEARPRLSWKIRSTERDLLQTSYQIQVATNLKDLERGKNLIWDSGEVKSDQSANVIYSGPAPGSGQRYYWKVKVRDNKSNNSEWSSPSWWETGITHQDWQAEWISPPWVGDKEDARPSPFLRHDFKLKNNIESARLYITSRGLYEARLNGKKVGKDLFTPGWTSYETRLQYQTYDVTEMLSGGDNAIGVILGDGWYRGTIGWVDAKNHYGDRLAVLAQLEVTYSNGKTETIVSDDTWKANTGPIVESEIYHGEVYDARLEIPGWDEAGYAAGPWRNVEVLDYTFDNIIEPEGVPVRIMDSVKVKEIFTAPNGDLLVDFGQNLVGHVRLKVQGPAGQKITINHAEVLDKEGNIYLDNLRAAKARLEYTLKGGGVEVHEPRFTFMGFRYIRVQNWPGDLKPDDLMGMVVHSAMEKAGEFVCSNPQLNQLQHNIQWGQIGNFLDVPTDCPQRDERLGWTGDAQAFASTAAFNYDVAAFFLKWLKDLEADQTEKGAVPHVIPNVLGKNANASAGWADAATIIPWDLYKAYGDTTFLRRQYNSMKEWVRFMEETAGDNLLWNSGFHFGDWLFFSLGNDTSGRSAVTDKYLIAQMFFIHSTEIMVGTARILGKNEDVAYFEDLLKKLKDAFHKEYVTPSGRMVSSTQTAYVLALAFDVFPESERAEAAKRLADNVQSYGHLTTGFLGTPYLCHVLSENGYLDLAYELLERTEYPSWLYPVTMGATTIWERWDGMKPDSTFQSEGMNSFNHYAYGAIGDWMYKVVAGIDIDEDHPGYRNVLIQPQPGGSLTNAEATHETPYGKVVSSWKKEGGQMQLTITVPPNSTASVTLPGAKKESVKEGNAAVADGNGIHQHMQQGNNVQLHVGSGSYKFTYPIDEEQ